MTMRELMALNRGAVVPFNKKSGEPVDLFINDRHIARGEIQIAENGMLEVQINEVKSSGPA
jgi:flagellar motor switch protein FliN/FliY